MNTLIETLNEVYVRARDNPHAPLYTRLYASAEAPRVIRTIDDWRALPPLEKEYLVNTPFWERTFSTPAGIDYIRASSGTSGKNLLVVPKTRLMPTPRVMSPETQTGILTFLQPQHQYEMDYWSFGTKIPVIAGDPINLEASVRLAAEVGVSSIQTYPFILEQKLPLLERYGMTDSLRLLVLTGERVSLEDARRYASIFPHATVTIWYASIECQGVPAWAVVGQDSEELVYTPGPDYYWELLDEDGGVIDANDVEGEVAYTTLWTEPPVLPLIRYRTGDMATRHTGADNNAVYRILGRKHIDRIKIVGGELRIEEVEAALLSHFGAPVEFELHYQKRAPRNLPPQILLRIKAGAERHAPEHVAHAICSTLKIAPQTTYGAVVESGAHDPLRCELVEEFPYTARKKKKFNVHEDALPE